MFSAGFTDVVEVSLRVEVRVEIEPEARRAREWLRGGSYRADEVAAFHQKARPTRSRTLNAPWSPADMPKNTTPKRVAPSRPTTPS